MRRPFRPYRLGRAGSAAALCALCVVLAPLPGPGQPAAVRAPGRLARLSSEVYRLSRETSRLRSQYDHSVRAAQEERLRADRLETELRGQRVLSSALHEDAGAAARAQYRTGGFTARGSDEAAADPVELLDLQSADSSRRDRLGRMLESYDRRGRILAFEKETAIAARLALDDDVARLRDERLLLERRLEQARGELNVTAATAVGRGRCPTTDAAAVRAQDDSVAEPRDERPGGVWTRPVEGYELSAGFGGAGAKWAGRHTGQDFAVPTGTPVRAVGPGTVVSTGCGGAFGMSVVVRHDDGWYSQYAHLSAPFVQPGQRVQTAEWLGLSGTTGNSTGPHLHFEIRRTPEFGSAVEPVGWLRRHGVRL
ncbi:M23 family metallopeptidase [Streptomyces sp. NPDC049577]|uniref:M23 family metallopeptidase n=1 Tax=Streptomyces sp. NPDC049577 TaxID=3155153 RepID=UPI003412611C